MSEAVLNSDGFQNLVAYVQRTRGFDLTAYKRTGLERRVSKRMAAAGISAFSDYIDFLEVHPEEFTSLFNTIMINVTGFFRDSAIWEHLQASVLPRLLAHRDPDAPLRVWTAACSSGEEAYTTAIVLAEILGVAGFLDRVKIYATDVDEDALSRARSGCYSARSLECLTPELLSKYFESVGPDEFQFRKDLRRNLIFGNHDLIQDAPISRIDLLTCRNALMYFNADAQAKILSRFHFALNEGGVLVLGKAEMLLNYNATFVADDLKRRIFIKQSAAPDRARPLSLGQASLREEFSTGPAPGQGRLRDAALELDSVAQVVIDLNGQLTFANSKARELFHLAARDSGRLLQDLELSYRPVELRSLIEQVVAERRPQVQKEVYWPTKAGEARWLEVALLPLTESTGALLGVKATFADVTVTKRLSEELAQNRQELQSASEELQSSNEELETTNEELQSTVEELETTNEELQSTNEELETMNEELQSTNEEMEGINDELRRRSEELKSVNAFLESILTGLRFGVAVLNQDLEVQVWSCRAEDMWGLRSEETVGQNFLNLDIGLPVEGLRSSIRETLQGAADGSTIALPAVNRRGRSFVCNVTTTALVGADSQVKGVILLMEEERAGQTEPARN